VKLIAFVFAVLLASGASGKEVPTISNMLRDGYKIISTSYQVEIQREAIYLEKNGRYWVCFVGYNFADWGDIKAPYVGGGICLPLLEEDNH